MIIPSVLASVGLIALLGLGTWQIQRKAWKEGLIATLAARFEAPPIALPPPAEWNALTPDNSEFTRVRLRVEFTGASDALVYTSGSALRDDVKGAGYFIFSPARLADGTLVVINRGFTSSQSYPAASGPHDIVGALRFPEPPSWFVSAHNAAGDIWTVRDQRAMAQARGWGAVAPFYIEQESPVPPGGVPHPAPLNVHLRNDHLQYAITWYGLAVVFVVMFVIWTLKRRREELGEA